MYLAMRQERKKLGWSQEFVAQQVGVTPEAIHYIETGQRKPSYDVLVKLEDLFGLTHRQLFGAATPGNRKKAGRQSGEISVQPKNTTEWLKMQEKAARRAAGRRCWR